MHHVFAMAGMPDLNDMDRVVVFTQLGQLDGRQYRSLKTLLIQLEVTAESTQ